MRSIMSLALAGVLLFGAHSVGADDAVSPEQIEFFESQVRPLLAEQCHTCHGAEKQKASLRLDSREAILLGGETGPALVPGKPESSLLLTAVKQTGDLQMPPKGKLTDAQIAVLEKWVALGAPFPAAVSIPDAEKLARQKRHWAFQRVHPVEPPAVKEAEWCRTPVDQFILAALDHAQLPHSPPADRRTLIRRLTYDLTGLPPTPEEVDAFVRDADPQAYRRLVDRLLDSPQYGEQWARHWLDVARYSDTKGYVYAREERFWVHAPVYRDWVVQALNTDMPYDRFLTLQIAADQAAPEDKPNLAAMGFLTLGRRFLGITHDIYDDRIDVVTRGTMGLTASCARCHDHKYDPIPTADYYSLYGVFMNSRETLVPIAEPTEKSEAYLALEKELAGKIKTQDDTFAAKRTEAAERVRSRLKDYLVAQTELHKAPQEGFDIIIATSDLVPALVWRWEAYIATEIQVGNPVFLPWKVFSQLSNEQWSSNQPPVGELLLLTSESESNANRRIVKSLTQAPLPTSMKEVAQRYAQVLSDVDREWKAALAAATAAGSPAPTQLPDEEDEALRQVMYGPASPCVIPNESILSTEIQYDSGSVDALWKLHNDIDRTIINNPLAPAHAVTLVDREVIRPNRILRRGNPATKVGFVDRHFLSLIAGPQPPPFTHGSGRLQLAKAIVDPANPLTARVWVNRLWQHHFGTGLVRTPSDFGIRAEAPSHPELLDWLATQLTSNGWSTKAIHRLIVLSNTYQQSSDGFTKKTLTSGLSPDRRGEQAGRAEQFDPENRLLWRANIQRLEAEQICDALFAVSGSLDCRIGGKTIPLRNRQYVFDHTSIDATRYETTRRALYLPLIRNHLYDMLEQFDYPDPSTSTGLRNSTVVSPQALLLMNSDLATDTAQAFVKRLFAASPDKEQRLRDAYRIAFAREATDNDLRRAENYLTVTNAALNSSQQDSDKREQQTWTQFCQALMMSNEFIYLR